MEKIIINCDDYGLSHETNSAILKLLEKQKITDITIMTERGFIDGDRLSALKITSLGLHLDLDHFFYFDENHHYGIDETDIIPDYLEVFNKNEDDIRNSIKEQIEILISNDINISHIDSHHSIHQFLPVLKILVQIANEYNIKKMRFNHKFYCSNEQLSQAKKIIEENNIIIPEKFYDLNEIIYRNIDINEVIETNQTVEIMAHVFPKNEQYNFLMGDTFTDMKKISFKDL